MADVTLGSLIKARRQQAQLSQEALARLVRGLSRGALNSIEQGATKSVAPDVANELVKVLPLTMAELMRSMGYELPTRQTPLPPALMEVLETATDLELEAVRALLIGYQGMRQESRRREAS